MALPPGKQRQLYEWFMRNNRQLTKVIALAFVATVVFYLFHLDNTPITERQRFITLTRGQYEKVCKWELEQVCCC
jgi:hypothetical protein